MPASVFPVLHSAYATSGAESAWSAGFFYRPAGEARQRIHITGANVEIQFGLRIYLDDRLGVAVLSCA